MAQLSGSYTSWAVADLDLTTLAADGYDWCWGGKNGGTAYFDHKSGGTANFTIAPDGGNPIRIGYGPVVSWTDGNTTPSYSSNYAFGQFSLNYSMVLTCDADTTARKLSIYTSAYHGTMTLTASLSDSSASNFVQAVTNTTGTTGALFEIIFQAGSGSQTLTVTMKNTASYNSQNNIFYGAFAEVYGTPATDPTITFSAAKVRQFLESGSPIASLTSIEYSVFVAATAGSIVGLGPPLYDGSSLSVTDGDAVITMTGESTASDTDVVIMLHQPSSGRRQFIFAKVD